MNHPAKRRKLATDRKRRAKASTRPARPIILTGIDEVPATDMDPGAPDVVELTDLEETARPSGPPRDLGLAAGDLDASFHGLDSGEEAPGGSDPLPDQDDVDEIGRALGIEEQDEKPLATTEKVEARDERRWELDPASSEDFEERQRGFPPGGGGKRRKRP